MAYLEGVGTTIILLVIVAAELPEVASTRRAITWISLQTGAFVLTAGWLRHEAHGATKRDGNDRRVTEGMVPVRGFEPRFDG